METSKLISRIKISHLPCYLSDNESAPTPLYADSITFHEFKQLNYHSFPLESLNQVPTDVALSLQCADCPSVAKLPESASFGVVDKRTLVSKLGRAVRGYLRGDSLDRDAGKRKVKCASLEKITPDDLCLFYRYKYSAQQIKRTVYSKLIWNETNNSFIVWYKFVVAAWKNKGTVQSYKERFYRKFFCLDICWEKLVVSWF